MYIYSPCSDDRITTQFDRKGSRRTLCGIIYSVVLCMCITQEKQEYVAPIEEAIKYLIVRGWSLSKVRAADISGIPLRTKTLCLRKKKKKKDGSEEELYEPEVLDLSKVTTPVEMLATAEMMAEDAHDRWASNLKSTTSEHYICTCVYVESPSYADISLMHVMCWLRLFIC